MIQKIRYPQPYKEVPQWKNLNGTWEFSFDEDGNLVYAGATILEHRYAYEEERDRQQAKRELQRHNIKLLHNSF